MSSVLVEHCKSAGYAGVARKLGDSIFESLQLDVNVGPASAVTGKIEVFWITADNARKSVWSGSQADAHDKAKEIVDIVKSTRP